MQQPMQNPEDISDPITALDMALELMSKAFQLNNTTTTNNNQRSLSNPCYSQIAQSFQNQGTQNVGNQNGLSVVPRIANQHGNGNVVVARAEVNANRNNYKSAEVHHSKNCYDNDIFNMFTQEEQYTELLEPIPKSHQVPQNDSNVISEVSSVEQSRGTVEQHPATLEEKRALYDSLYNNLATEVEKVNSVNCNLRETNVDLTTEFARY
ncbi:hypothetical protein Tco_1486726 [Tanacetum coccineum]